LRSALALALAAGVLALAPARAAAEPRRFALLVGVEHGLAGDEPLQYAEEDAARIAAILRDLGGFQPEDVLVLNDVTAAEFRRSLIAMNARAREAGGDTLLFVFYSGHADADALHLAGTRLLTGELRDLVYGSPATARVLVIDACRSGGVTRRKGGRRAPAFAIDLDERLRSEGVAILTSSAAGEDAQESDELAASFFTHYLASALRGAADRDVDGRVTLVEAFTFASERTLSATARTLAGPQHPSYRFDLSGREDLVLTRPVARGRRIGTLTFAEAGAYLVQQGAPGGAPIAEIDVGGGARALALPAGEYLVTRRATDHLLQGRFTVTPAAATSVRAAAMERIAYARVVRKGGTGLRRTLSGFVSAGLRSGHDDLGFGPRLDVGARIDLPVFSLELRLVGAWSEGTTLTGKGPLRGRELGAELVALRALDLGGTTVAGGLALGAVWFSQEQGLEEVSIPEGPIAHGPNGALVGALAQVQRMLAGPIYARLEVAATGYVFDARPAADAPLAASVVWSSGLGLGAFF
jgi:hypothetical protein